MKYQLKNLTNIQIQDLGNKLKSGAIAIIPTDTQYGIVTSALNQQSVEKVYQLRKRSSDKPLIVLIPTLQDIKNFGIIIDPKQEIILKKLWPNPVSIIVPAIGKNLAYLHRGKNSLAFRLPKTNWLIQLLKISGPLVAPSANFEGEKPASNIEEAEQYFENQIDFYLDDGDKTGRSSTIIKLLDENFELIREGDYKISKL